MLPMAVIVDITKLESQPCLNHHIITPIPDPNQTTDGNNLALTSYQSSISINIPKNVIASMGKKEARSQRDTAETKQKRTGYVFTWD